MLELLNRFGLGQRILALSLMPFIIGTVFALMLAFEARVELDRANKLRALTDYAPTISGLVHELQKERGLSAGYLGSKGGSAQKAALENQRTETDKALSSFNSAYTNFDYETFGVGFTEIAKTAKTEIDKLANVRREVTSQGRTIKQMAGYYTPTIARLLSIIENAATLRPKRQEKSQLISVSFKKRNMRAKSVPLVTRVITAALSQMVSMG